jgi:hypothetical protein
MNWENLERIGLFITLAGFAVLGYFSYRTVNNNRQIIERINSVETSLNSLAQSVSNLTIQQFNNSCDTACIRKLVDEAIASVGGITNPQKEQVIERVVEKVQTVSSGPKTQYITLGGGETSSTSWTDISGAEVSFDIADFGQIKQIFFEVSLFSPSGKVLARLWDKRAGTIVSGSEVSHIAGDAQVKSSPVTIPAAGRTIILQLKSEVAQPVKANTSRLRIDTK